MKAEERHRLKTNELAQSLSELPEYLRKHGSKILTIGIAIVVVFVGGTWWWGARTEAGQERVLRLNALLGRRDAIQLQAIQQARLEANPGQEQLSGGSYGAEAETLASSFGALSVEVGNATVGATALLQQAHGIGSIRQPLGPVQIGQIAHRQDGFRSQGIAHNAQFINSDSLGGMGTFGQ